MESLAVVARLVVAEAANAVQREPTFHRAQRADFNVSSERGSRRVQIEWDVQLHLAACVEKPEQL